MIADRDRSELIHRALTNARRLQAELRCDQEEMARLLVLEIEGPKKLDAVAASVDRVIEILSRGTNLNPSRIEKTP